MNYKLQYQVFAKSGVTRDDMILKTATSLSFYYKLFPMLASAIPALGTCCSFGFFVNL